MENSECKATPDYVIETSWEVCNKIGGIYTVLSTKAATMHKSLKDNLIFIGPDVWTEENPCPVFTPEPKLLESWGENAMLPEGVDARVGRWEIPGRPITILVKFKGLEPKKNEIYGRMWQEYGVDSLHAYGDYDDSCLFAVAAAMVAETLAQYFTEKSKKDAEKACAKARKASKTAACPEASKPNIVAHFDEWTTGMGLLYLKSVMPSAATVFTTHATSIGRSICCNGKQLYKYFDGYDGDVMANELNMQSKHSLEKHAAAQADCFTTVSAVTARECQHLLGTDAYVTPNGFESSFVPKGRAYKEIRSEARSRIIDVARALTGIDYDDSAFIVATSGRCEYRNKGIDVFIDVVERLRREDASRLEGRKVIALILVPAWSAGPRPDLIAALDGGTYNGLPDCVITHRIHNYGDDPIYGCMHSLGFNIPGDVSLIYVPCYLNGEDAIFDMKYYDVLCGLDATVFPSYYEPWGYTPLESAAFGVPTVTTSLSGFGQWIIDNFQNSFAECGVKTEHRDDDNYLALTEAIADDLITLATATPAQLAAISRKARATAALASWKNFYPLYQKAYAKALCIAAQRNNKKAQALCKAVERNKNLQS